jgi:geranylgeranyl transferase type-2 subunit beta
MPAYLQELTLRLATGLGNLPDWQREMHAQYFLAAQQPDGGFRGREGDSDLYYTSFALRGLALLGELHGATADRAASFLKSRLGGEVPIVDFLSLIYSAALLDLSAGIKIFADAPTGWQQNVGGTLERLRRPDGGYAKSDEGQYSSLYHTFLVVLCQQLLDLPLVEPGRLKAFVLDRQREDGGFVEMAQVQRSGTNPTAAGIGLLRILDALDNTTRQRAVDFLIDMQTDDGGLRANTRLPIPDLLSTFTGALTLLDLDAGADFEAASARRLAESLQLPTGGFRAGAWDPGHDVEYTFYGLGTLALTAENAPSETASSEISE